MDAMRKNIDAWWPLIEKNTVEYIAMTASGCGATVREYGPILHHDPAYAEKAARISGMTRDISEILAEEQDKLRQVLDDRKENSTPARLAFHSPCTLQHGQQIRGKAEHILQAAGFELTAVPDAHLCCGSAGTYSILQPDLSKQLLNNKVSALESGRPQCIATANIGCLTQIAAHAGDPPLESPTTF